MDDLGASSSFHYFRNAACAKFPTGDNPSDAAQCGRHLGRRKPGGKTALHERARVAKVDLSVTDAPPSNILSTSFLIVDIGDRLDRNPR